MVDEWLRIEPRVRRPLIWTSDWKWSVHSFCSRLYPCSDDLRMSINQSINRLIKKFPADTSATETTIAIQDCSNYTLDKHTQVQLSNSLVNTIMSLKSSRGIKFRSSLYKFRSSLYRGKSKTMSTRAQVVINLPSLCRKRLKVMEDMAWVSACPK